MEERLCCKNFSLGLFFLHIRKQLPIIFFFFQNRIMASFQEVKGDVSMEEQLSPPGDDEYYVEDKGCQTESIEGEMEVCTKDDVQQITGTLENLKTADKINIEPSIIIIAPFSMPQSVLDTREVGIQWIGTPRVSIDSVTNKILAELKGKDPKWITVTAYQQFLSTHDSATIEKHLSKITRAAVDSKIHKISLGTFFHVPEEEKIWDKVSMLNQHLRLLNLDMGMTPNNVHKSLTYSFNQGKVSYVRYNVWVERMNSSGVGATLNFEGLTRYKNYLLKYIHQGGFKEQQGPMVRAIGGDGSPAPLCHTRGYKGNEKMLEIMKAKGLRVPVKPMGDNRSDLQKKMDKARATAKKFAEESKARYGDNFEERGEKEKQPKKGGKENGMKSGKERLEARDKKRKEDKEHQLTLEVSKLKLESLRARSRSKTKYEEFEREIDRLKDKLKEKERLVSELRRDLARAEVDCEEWREIADRARVFNKGPKRARRY